MGLYCPTLGVERVFFFAFGSRSRSRDRPPMVENMRNMPDMLRRDSLDDAHNQIPVLRSFVAGREPACLPTKASPNCHQVANKVLREEERRVPVGLEVWTIADTFLVNLVFVTVDQTRIGMSVELGC